MHEEVPKTDLNASLKAGKMVLVKEEDEGGGGEDEEEDKADDKLISVSNVISEKKKTARRFGRLSGCKIDQRDQREKIVFLF